MRGLALKSVTDGVLAEKSDPFLEHAADALCLDTVNGSELAGRSEKHGIEHLFPWMQWILPPFHHVLDQIGPVKEFIEMGFEQMAPHRLQKLLAAEKAAQIDIGNLGGGFVEALAQLDVVAHLVGHYGRNV